MGACGREIDNPSKQRNQVEDHEEIERAEYQPGRYAPAEAFRNETAGEFKPPGRGTVDAVSGEEGAGIGTELEEGN